MCAILLDSDGKTYKKGSRDGFPFYLYVQRRQFTFNLRTFDTDFSSYRSVQFQHSHECTLRHLYSTDLTHSLLTLFLFFQELSLT